MEPITIFASTVGLIGVCRLTFAATEFLGKGIYSRGSKPAKRDKWFCFFKTTDLLGDEKRQQPPVAGESLERRRRLHQQRPRLRVE
ncbi:MAG: hypothetical protein JRC87_01480 [Deltaproteobacteria bacterium]|nr:hypothetical protein [Deltaproteobacteria bacterium]MBW2658262.1 hypothetical protein [Deltaproteobacteria bacterium]